MTTKIKTDSLNGKRVESGALKINDDWKGMFLRGDDSCGLLASIQTIVLPILKKHESETLMVTQAISQLEWISEIIGEVLSQEKTEGENG